MSSISDCSQIVVGTRSRLSSDGSTAYSLTISMIVDVSINIDRFVRMLAHQTLPFRVPIEPDFMTYENMCICYNAEWHDEDAKGIPCDV